MFGCIFSTLSVCYLRGNSKYHYYGLRIKSGSPLLRLMDEQQHMAMRQQPFAQKNRHGMSRHPDRNLLAAKRQRSKCLTRLLLSSANQDKVHPEDPRHSQRHVRRGGSAAGEGTV